MCKSLVIMSCFKLSIIRSKIVKKTLHADFHTPQMILKYDTITRSAQICILPCMLSFFPCSDALCNDFACKHPAANLHDFKITLLFHSGLTLTRGVNSWALCVEFEEPIVEPNCIFFHFQNENGQNQTKYQLSIWNC